MGFAKRPTLNEKPMAKAAVPVQPVSPPAQAHSLLDDPDQQNPTGLILRVIAACLVAFLVAAAISLWMKPAEWWEDESCLPRPVYAAHSVAHVA